MSLNERLEKCAAAIHRLDKGGNPVPQIEIDMALEELRRLYEAVLQLNVPVAAAAPEPAAPQEPAAAPLKEEVVVPVVPIIPVQEEAPSAPEEAPVVVEPAPEPMPEPVPEPEPEPVPEPVVETAPVVEPAPAPAQPAEEPTLFAEDQSEMATPSPAMPTVEQVSDMPNDTLFADEPAAPATIWEKLQSQQAAPSFADTVQPQQTLSERLAEQKPAPEPSLLHQPVPQAAPAVEPQPQPESAAVQPTPEPEPEPEPEPAPKPAPEPTPEPQPAPASPAAAQPSLMDILKQTNNTHTPVAAQRMLGDTFTAPTTVEDDFVQLRKHKVDDLRTVININDKFSFMSELFHNNMKAYNDFIMTLNVTPTREEALEIVANTSSQYGWDEDSVAVKNFYNILNRKF
ncbi:MAG: hypothetical protein K6E93_01275 [Bacteroidales bacterium]|nr:hypothetical protein [Bacteroidales bacterium]